MTAAQSVSRRPAHCGGSFRVPSKASNVDAVSLFGRLAGIVSS